MPATGYQGYKVIRHLKAIMILFLLLHGSDGKHVMFFVDLNVYSGNFHDCPAEYTHFTIAVDMPPGPRWQNFRIARLTGTVFVSGEMVGYYKYYGRFIPCVMLQNISLITPSIREDTRLLPRKRRALGEPYMMHYSIPTSTADDTAFPEPPSQSVSTLVPQSPSPGPPDLPGSPSTIEESDEGDEGGDSEDGEGGEDGEDSEDSKDSEDDEDEEKE
ncbi:uncharacterized protein AtWU_11332 [Aspergillus tubingensis]|uniref:uncharacterized protein n=1 Tax=Aspergillus tubingensis TaxID=5068 RepID=UPI0015782285|nr:uncharacterized protein AtWU_11332 [Aspergillus tubingensis]GFN21523.1 predicted protein [Aspergillus tubingensis]